MSSDVQTIIIGEYEYYPNPIGYGSFSILYKGWSTHTKLPVAIKKITKIVNREYFHNEIKLMQGLNHPNILKLYDVIENNETNEQYLILEYCNGGELKDVFKGDDHTHDLEYFNQMVNGLEYLNLHSITHRDIKPQNILIHNHTLKISDFGFAKSFQENEIIQTYCGTPLYMAPEILRNQDYDTSSDIWSIGVILYELFCRKHPYRVANKKELLKIMESETLVIDYSKLPPHAPTEIIRECLRMKPGERITWSELFRKTRLFYKTYLLKFQSPTCFSSSSSQNLGASPRLSPMIIASSSPYGTPPRVQSANIAIIQPRKQSRRSIVNTDMNDSVIQNNNNINSNIFMGMYPETKFSTPSPSPSLSSSIMDNYIRSKTADVEKERPQIMLIGQSPTIRGASVSSSLEKSYRTIKNFFGFSLQ